jgi:hypothetical protein
VQAVSAQRAEVEDGIEGGVPAADHEDATAGVAVAVGVEDVGDAVGDAVGHRVLADSR